MIRTLYKYLKKRGFYVHALGFSTFYADSFDTMGPFAWWFGKKYNDENLREFIRYFLKRRSRYENSTLEQFL